MNRQYLGAKLGSNLSGEFMCQDAIRKVDSIDQNICREKADA